MGKRCWVQPELWCPESNRGRGTHGVGHVLGELVLMADPGTLSWTSWAEKSEGPDGSENAPDQCIGGLTDGGRTVPLQGRDLSKSRARSCVSSLARRDNALKI